MFFSLDFSSFWVCHPPKKVLFSIESCLLSPLSCNTHSHTKEEKVQVWGRNLRHARTHENVNNRSEKTARRVLKKKRRKCKEGPEEKKEKMGPSARMSTGGQAQQSRADQHTNKPLPLPRSRASGHKNKKHTRPRAEMGLPDGFVATKKKSLLSSSVRGSGVGG